MSQDTPTQGAPRFIRNTRTVLAVLLLASLVLIAQRASQFVYTVGVLLTIVTVLLGFTFNNLPEETSFAGIVKGLIITWIITGGVVGISIVSAPLLTTLGR